MEENILNRLVLAIFLMVAGTSHADLKNAQSLLSEGRYEEAISEAKPLAEKGDLNAEAIIGVSYLHLAKSEDEFNRAESHLKSPAYRGQPTAAYNLAIYYHFVLPRSLGQESRFEEAMTLYYIAAQGGIQQAMANLAFINYEEGNLEESLFWFLVSLNGKETGLGKAPAEEVQKILDEIEARLGAKKTSSAHQRASEWLNNHATAL